MGGFSGLVLPFQSVDVTYPRRIVKSDATPPSNVVLKVGDNGGLKTLHYSQNYSLQTYMQQKQKEKPKGQDTDPDDQPERHVKRIIGKTKDGNGNVSKVPEAWIDVERDDAVTTQEGSGLNYQKTKTKFQWYLDDAGEMPNPSRKTKTVTVIPADDDPDNPSVYWEIEANEAITIRDDDQEITRRFDNSKDNTRRRTEKKNRVRRVVHSDTPYDNDPKYEDGGVIKNYEKTPDTKDTEQHIDVEIIGSYGFDDYRVNKLVTPNHDHWQRTVIERDIDYLIDDSEETDQSYADDEIGPPYRLDPAQRIVNVQYKAPEEVLIAHSVSDGSSQVTRDGETYQDGFGKVLTAASGLGKTVADITDEVVFGKPRDDTACFIRIISGAAGILRGAPDEQGNLSWSTVGTIDDDSGAVSLSFAGEAFFVSSNDGDSNAFLYVSFDGKTWRKGNTAVKPNGGEDNQNGQPEGNHVAYDPDNKVYCHTGWFIRGFQYDIVDTDDGRRHTTHASSSNFWSATSRDGIHWTPKYDMSKFYSGGDGETGASGGLGSPGTCAKSVAYGGAGVFIAPTSYVIEYDYFNFAGVLNVFQHLINRIDSCGYAVSRDGVTWSNSQLPGAYWDPGIFIFDIHGSGANNRTATQGLTQGVVWCKTGGTDPETKKPKGFFMIIGFELSSQFGDGRDGIFHKKRWTSPNGRDWKMVFDLNDPSSSGPVRKTDDVLSVHKKNADPKKVIKV